MNLRTSTILLRLVLAALIAFLPATAAMAEDDDRKGRVSVAVPITGSAVDAAAANATPLKLAGTFTIKRFVRQNAEVFAVGTLVATLTDPGTGGIVRTFATQVALPTGLGGAAPAAAVIAQQQASCEILHLELGPLDLNLLGLVVHLDKVVLDITAVPGAGNLLGNLLCSIAGALDGGSSLSRLVALLNRLLDILG